VAIENQGHGGEAEREELALYRAENPDLVAECERVPAEGAEGADDGETGWLARVEADRRLKHRENSATVRIERGLGLGLTCAGFFMGPMVMVPGLAILVWSFARVRLATYKDDPYTEVEE